MIFSFLVFLSFFLIILFGTARLWRMSEAELRQRLHATEARIGFLSAAIRAPLGWLLASVIAVLMSLSLWALDFTDSALMKIAAAGFSFGWLLATALAAHASFRGRPTWLVHPCLRADKD